MKRPLSTILGDSSDAGDEFQGRPLSNSATTHHITPQEIPVPQRDTTITGAPCWVDLFTSDPEKSNIFYGELFGWTSEAAGEEYGGYIRYSKDGKLVAGGMRNDGSAGSPDTWTVYLEVADAAATVAAAEAAGGQVHLAAMAIPPLGTMAMVADPGGAAVGLWQPEEHPGFGVVGEPGTPTYFEVHARRYDETVAFYRQVFGWDTYVAADGSDFRYTTLGEGDAAVAGAMDATGILAEGEPASWSVYFAVEDTDATLVKLVDLGGSVLAPAEDTPYGRLAHVADPTGASFRLIAR